MTSYTGMFPVNFVVMLGPLFMTWMSMKERVFEMTVESWNSGTNKGSHC
jgi:hypothetical protein